MALSTRRVSQVSVCCASNPAKRLVEIVVARLDSDTDKAVRHVSIDIVITWEKSFVSRCWLHSCLMLDTFLCLEIYLRIKSLKSLPCGAYLSVRNVTLINQN